MTRQQIRGFPLSRILRIATLLVQKEVRSMMRAKSDLANEIIGRVLLLSADAQIARRSTAKDSAAFHNLSGAIAAYGKVLAVLSEVRRQEEFYALLRELDLPEYGTEQVH